MNQTKRRISQGAEEFLGVQIPVLDKGWIALVDYMGNDATVVEAARVSYGKQADEDDVVGTEKLIKYLLRNDHGTPFEMPELCFNVKAPIFVFREWHRHRTANINEISGRYTQLPAEYYVPLEARIKLQSTSNKQGSGQVADEDLRSRFFSLYELNADETFEAYDEFVKAGLAKEIARIGLPVSTYSQMRWKCDLRNLLHFLKLRMASNAQEEIRAYANEIAKVVKASFPIVYSAFEEYVLGSTTLSATERRVLSKVCGPGKEGLPKELNDVLAKLAA